MRNVHTTSNPAAATQPIAIARRESGLRGAVNRVLDGVAPRVENRAMLVKMGCGRPSLVGDHSRGNHVTRSFHIL